MTPEEVWDELRTQQRESEDRAEKSWDTAKHQYTPMDSRKFQEEYMGNFESIPVPVKDCPAGRRIDEAIVKALGWRINHWEDEADGGWELLDTKDNWMGSWSKGSNPKGYWSPSTYINAAWKLVEIQLAAGFTVEMDTDIKYGKVEYLFAMQRGEEFSGYVVADTAPLAISRAFLLSHGIQEIPTQS